jgi:hypothetical protein
LLDTIANPKASKDLKDLLGKEYKILLEVFNAPKMKLVSNVVVENNTNILHVA